MTLQLLLFYLFSTVLVLSALAVVSVRNPIYAALFLVLSFFTSAVIWLLFQAEFLAITLVLVYVGAVMVLFLFVVMMLDVNLNAIREGFAKYLPVGLIVAATMLIELILVVSNSDNFTESVVSLSGTNDISNTKALGLVLYTDYFYAFEIASVILLVAIIAAIMLTLRVRSKTKMQNPSRQVKATKEQRLRIVSMDSEQANNK